jgi:hypothetical protein
VTPAARAELVRHLAAALVADVRQVHVPSVSGVAPAGNARTVVGRLAGSSPEKFSYADRPLENRNPEARRRSIPTDLEQSDIVASRSGSPRENRRESVSGTPPKTAAVRADVGSGSTIGAAGVRQ